MNHIPDIGLVNAHAERDGRYNHLNLIANERFLMSFTGVITQACMVRERTKPFCLKQCGGLVNTFSAGTINNPGLPSIFFYQRNKLGICMFFEPDIVKKVWPVKRSPDDKGSAQSKFIQNILLHKVGCRCSKRSNRQVGKECHQIGQRQIVGSEIVPPLRYAVSLINHRHADLHPAEHLSEVVKHKPFRRHINQVEGVCKQLLHHPVTLIRQKRAVEKCRSNTVNPCPVYLVFHQ